MGGNPSDMGGWLESLRSIGASIMALLHNRFELFTVEWQEEKLRFLETLVWLAVGLALGLAGVLVALTALALWLWQVAGYGGLLGLAASALVGAFAILSAIRRKIKTGPLPFAQTVAEFKKDGECLPDKK